MCAIQPQLRLFTCLVLLSLSLWSLPVLDAQTYRSEPLTIADGLSQGMIYDIEQTQDGFLWFATKDGLNRYDGYRFEVFTNDPFSPFSIGGEVQDLAEIMGFTPNLHQGSIELPVPFTMPSSTGTVEPSTMESFEVVPNPFRTETYCQIKLAHSQEFTLTVTDANGKQVLSRKHLGRQGLNTIAWKGDSMNGELMGSGLYFIRLTTENGL